MTELNDFVPDYLLVGHITHDVTPQGPRLGGTVSYGAHTAAALGLRVGILTSTMPNEPLLHNLPPQVRIHCIPAEQTTMFENRYTDDGRIQYMYRRAVPLGPEALPPAWRQTRLIHLGPIANEVDPAIISAFGSKPICITPQGWMRGWEPDGRIIAIPWKSAEQVLPNVRMTVLSEEDIRHNPGLESVFARLSPLLVVTRAEHGCSIYKNGHRQDYPAHRVKVVDPTGAGDIFATALHIALDRFGNLDSAVKFATYLAGQSVTRVGFSSAPTPDEAARAWNLYSSDGISA
jgi:sugar/nucleoside kinase (ribokinase family)